MVRMAPSFIRFGSFELFAPRNQLRIRYSSWRISVIENYAILKYYCTIMTGKTIPISSF